MNIYVSIPLTSVIVFIVVIGLTLTRRPLGRVHRVFILYLASSMLWSFSSFILHANFFPAQTLLWHRALVVVGSVTPIIYYHFIRAFFNKPAGKRAYLGYALIGGLAIYVSQGGFLIGSRVVDGILYHKFEPWRHLLSVLLAVFFGMAIFYLVQGLRRVTDPRDRNRINYLLAAILVWAVFMATDLFPALANYSIDHIGNIASAVIISYTIFKYELLDIKLIARRTLAYFIVVSCLAGVYIGVILMWHLLLPAQSLFLVLMLASGLAILLALLAPSLRYTIQEWIDHFFYRGTYKYRQTLLNFSSKMSNIINLDELADAMLPTISKALRTPQVKLLFEDTSSGDFTTQFTYPKAGDRLQTELGFAPDNPIVAWLEKEAEPINVKQIDSIPQLKALWQIERERLVNSNLEILCPIKSRGKLIGILALARKRPKAIYFQDDIELIMTMASQAGIIIENARMFDSLKKQQHRVERLLTRTVLIQEEERERISADLHDSVAQWLAAASYSVQTVNTLFSGNNNDKIQGELTEMENTIDKSLKELRRIVVGLRPPALNELGLTHALQQSLEDLKAEGLFCKFSEVGKSVRLPSSVEIAVYRVVQEALTNIRKHAKATRVNINLQFQPEKLLVEVRDNGRGFDLSQTLDSAISVGHLGLLGMKQRMEALGGDIKIKTGEEVGTTIILSIPIQASGKER